jgi:3-isopropylmalate/(R)-2-methylmalate dehydratase small subunit
MEPFRKHTGLVAPLDRVNVDTDQIIPKQFLKRVERTGFGEFLFYDWRRNADGSANETFVLNQPRYRGASVLVAGANFGCGSSREHAPQALLRWGIKALVGESFADIFFGNCVALGIPCVTANEADVLALMAAIEEEPTQALAIDIEALAATYRDKAYPITLPASARTQLLEGSWDATRILLQAEEQVRQTAARLPYTNGFKR